MLPKTAAALIALAAIAFCQDVRRDRLAIFEKDFRAAIERVRKRSLEPEPTNSVRDLPNAALGLLALGGNAREAERMIRLAFSSQEMNAESPAFGTVLWQLRHPEIKDANAIEFTSQSIGPIFLRYGGKLSPEFKKEMTPHIRAAIAAIRRHKVAVTYTNIFLMKTVNLILLNEVLGDEAGAAEGYAMLDQWMAHTRQWGVREFQSPTYYSVDLNCLTTGYLFAARRDAKEKFRRSLDFLWTDIAANYFAPRGTLSGPHSRDYDFLTGHGGIEFQLFQEGLRAKPATQGIDLEKVHFVVNELAGGYRAPKAILELAALPERVVESRWDQGDDRTRYHYITRDFAIGSSSWNYGPQDKPVSLELASDEMWPAISIVPDIFDEPYGKLKRPDRSGHNKPIHLPLYPVSVQEKGAMLVTLDLNPTRERDITSLATNIILPAGAALSIDGVPFDAGKPNESVLKPGAVVGVRHGNACVAIRLLQSDGAGGFAPQAILKADAAGLKHGAARLAAYHYRGDAKTLTGEHVRVAWFIEAAECATSTGFRELVDRAARAVFIGETGERVWKTTLQTPRITLYSERDTTTRAMKESRVNGRKTAIHTLRVNGHDCQATLN